LWLNASKVNESVDDVFILNKEIQNLSHTNSILFFSQEWAWLHACLI
jgi:hypothetical protein